jgi:hypothetical protein
VAEQEVKVRVKKGYKHGQLPLDYDPQKPRGAPGPKANGGDVIKVTEAEIASFGDKFIILDEKYKRQLEAKAEAEAKAKELAQD